MIVFIETLNLQMKLPFDGKTGVVTSLGCVGVERVVVLVVYRDVVLDVVTGVLCFVVVLVVCFGVVVSVGGAVELCDTVVLATKLKYY